MACLLCFGLGYSAQVLARRMLVRGFRITGTVRKQEPTDHGTDGFMIVPFDRQHPLWPSLFAGVTHVLVSIPPDATGDLVADIHRADLVRAAPQWVGYLSTTGVYGNTDGAWVDETAPLTPTVPRSIARVKAEQAWLTLWAQHGLPVHLFRLAGIYGPGRSAVDALRKGQAHRVIKPGHVSCRIHVEDLATVLEASMAHPDPGTAYNVCDDEPAPPQDVVAYAATLLHRALPPALSWEDARQTLSPMALTFYTDSRRVRNDRLKRRLGVSLCYPTYREGLAHCLASASQTP